MAWGATRGTTLQHADFYTNGRVKALYKNHVAWLLDRVNTINGCARLFGGGGTEF